MAELTYQVDMLSKRIKKTVALISELDDVPELKEQLRDLNRQRSQMKSELEALQHTESLTDKSLPQLANIDLLSKAGRVEAQLILSKYIKTITIQPHTFSLSLNNGNLFEGLSITPHDVYPEEAAIYTQNRMNQLIDDELGLLTGIKGEMRFKN